MCFEKVVVTSANRKIYSFRQGDKHIFEKKKMFFYSKSIRILFHYHLKKNTFKKKSEWFFFTFDVGMFAKS